MFDWVCSKLSQATVTVGSLKSQDMIKILKESGHDFSGKRLCGGYCTKILCDVFVRRSIFNIGSYGFVKKLLKVILFEFKGPWMLETDLVEKY